MYLQRARQIVPRIDKFIKKSDRVLDIGCGTGMISRTLKDKKGCKIALCDVAYNLMCDTYPVIIYDGKKLPFKDGEFSKALVIAVLHHCKNPMKILDEAARVSKKIIIMEDVFTDWFSRLVTFIGDCLVNFEIHSLFTNHTTEEWLKIFKKKKLAVENVEEFRLRCVGLPFKLAIFVLSKKI
ncbi:class I SAM-dependent methyltransferase [Candidatus Daviesbacteria bacterium]|nr:class I SAM-dependent methyltransferase [Candidatus Daviesbacteria bacterium]